MKSMRYRKQSKKSKSCVIAHIFCSKKEKTVNLFGRRKIKTSRNLTVASEVITALYEAVGQHISNVAEIDELYSYIRGNQPILTRTKQIRQDILNKIVVNIPLEITNFQTSYIIGEPCQYINNNSDTTVSESISALNNYMERLSKEELDSEHVWWMCVAGVSIRSVMPSPGKEVPFTINVLDPRSAFVVYSSGMSEEPVMGVFIGRNEKDEIIYTAYTKPQVYIVKSPQEYRVEDHYIGYIPFVECPFNNNRQGAFEPVITIVDAINTLESNRVDGVEQFIQSYMKFKGLEPFTEEELINIQETGVVYLPPDSDYNNTDFDIVSQSLDQQQVQVLVDDLDQKIRRIVQMPSQSDGNTSDSSNNGAAFAKNGWLSAEALAKSIEKKMRKADRELLRIVLRICQSNQNNKLASLTLDDIGISYTRRKYVDLVAKSQFLVNLLSTEQIHPLDAITSSEIFPDSNSVYIRGEEYHKQVLAEAAKQVREDKKTQPEKTAQTEK